MRHPNFGLFFYAENRVFKPTFRCYPLLQGTVKRVLSRVMRKIDWRQLKEELLCKGGIAESGLQMPHIHVLLVTPLGACAMAQAGADKHQGGIAIGEGTHNPGAPADLAVQAFLP